MPNITQDAANRTARTVIQALIGYLVALAAAHGLNVSPAVQDEILVAGTPIVAGLVAYVWRRYLDGSKLPSLAPPVAEPTLSIVADHGLVDPAPAAGTVPVVDPTGQVLGSIPEPLAVLAPAPVVPVAPADPPTPGSAA